MTYLQLVRSVLRRLREDLVATVNENAYSALVGELVNDAKRDVEAAWQWTNLVTPVSRQTVPGVSVYDLASDVKPEARPYIDPVTNRQAVYITTNGKEKQLSYHAAGTSYLRRIKDINRGLQATPQAMSIEAGPSLVLWPAPDDVYTITMFFVNPADDLQADSDVLTIPSEPVILLAYLYALYERGEELGENVGLITAKAETALGDAVMHDQALQGHVLQFTAD